MIEAKRRKAAQAVSWLLSAAMLVQAQGCAVAKADIDRAAARTSRRIAQELNRERSAPAVAVHDGNWLAGHEIPIGQPSAPEITQRVRLGAAAPASLREIAQRISQVTRIPVSLEPDLSESSGSPPPSARPAGAAPALPQLPPIPGYPGGLALPGLPAPDLAGMDEGDPLSLRAAYGHDGPLNELLDQIAARFGAAWEYKGGRISLSRFITRAYTLFLPPEIRTVEAEVGGKAESSAQSAGGVSTGTGGSGGGGGGGGSGGGGSQPAQGDGISQSVKSQAKLETWKEVEAAIQRMLTSKGRVATAPSSGDIVVTDTPAAVKRVADYVEQKNASLTRQVAVQVDVLSIEASKGEDFEIQWQAIFKSDDLGAALITPDLVTGATANLAMQLLRPKSDFSGTKTIAKILWLYVK